MSFSNESGTRAFASVAVLMPALSYSLLPSRSKDGVISQGERFYFLKRLIDRFIDKSFLFDVVLLVNCLSFVVFLLTISFCSSSSGPVTAARESLCAVSACHRSTLQEARVTYPLTDVSFLSLKTPKAH